MSFHLFSEKPRFFSGKGKDGLLECPEPKRYSDRMEAVSCYSVCWLTFSNTPTLASITNRLDPP